MIFLRFLRCFFTGHVPSGCFISMTSGRAVQYCAYCEGWLGSMFWWRPAQGIDARSGATACGRDPKDESPVANGDAPKPTHL